MPTAESARMHALVSGRVQGVGFRMFVLENARAMQLSGWVRNTWQGEVEVTAEGPRTTLMALLDILHAGPPSAFVSDVILEWQPFQDEFVRFEVRHTE